MDLNSIIGFGSLGVALAASHAKTQSDVSRLKAEVGMAREREIETAKLLAETNRTLHRIEKALVKAGLIDIE